MDSALVRKVRKERAEIYKGMNDTPMIYQTVRTGIPFNTEGFSALGMDITPSDFLELVDSLTVNQGDPDEIRPALAKWLMSKDLAPPRIPQLEPWTREREVQREKENASSSSPEKKLTDPGDQIDTRTLVFGILQRTPRIPAVDISKILRVSTDAIYHYRKEYTRRLQLGKKGSPEEFPEELEDWTDLQEDPVRIDTPPEMTLS